MKRVIRIAVVGGESTGKSTLCAQLAQHFDTAWVPEFARAYLEGLDREYVYEDLRVMAKGQIESEHQYESSAKGYLFCDTDMHVFKVWSEHKYGKLDFVIEELLNTVAYDAYILTSPDFPWQPDPLREHEAEEWRLFFFERYLNLVALRGKPICIVAGSEPERLAMAITFLEELDRNP